MSGQLRSDVDWGTTPTGVVTVPVTKGWSRSGKPGRAFSLGGQQGGAAGLNAPSWGKGEDSCGSPHFFEARSSCDMERLQ